MGARRRRSHSMRDPPPAVDRSPARENAYDLSPDLASWAGRRNDTASRPLKSSCSLDGRTVFPAIASPNSRGMAFARVRFGSDPRAELCEAEFGREAAQ